jgi:hypothetical protein
MRRLLPVALALLSVLLLAACGGGSSGGTGSSGADVVSGPGVSTGQPPWPLEQAHHAQRVRLVGAPLPGKETFHNHALLHVYANGLLVPVPAGIGYDPKRHIVSGIHTHDQTGVIHMEADKPFKTTLGDVFMEWGVAFGKDQLGGLKPKGADKVWVYVNGKPLTTDPVSYVIKKDDNIVVAYGKQGSFETTPFTGPLKDANAGKSSCGTKNGKSVGSCVVGSGGR